jgi:hypothetical protein
MGKKKDVIKAGFYPLEQITNEDIEAMHGVFVKYYHNADHETFVKDLRKKIGAILIKKIDDGAIVGFSTIGIIEKEIEQKKCLGIFSGDTVIEKAYWGLPNLQTAFLRFMVTMRIKNPLTNIYWFLISKGYKTYLLMANNWTDYYPRYDQKEDEERKRIVREFSNHFFAGHYDEETGLLNFGEGYQRLKEDVAEITKELKEKYPKIAFFEEVNPTWRKGTELPCIGDISWSFILWRPFPFAFRKLKNAIFGSKVRVRTKLVPSMENKISKMPVS